MTLRHKLYSPRETNLTLLYGILTILNTLANLQLHDTSSSNSIDTLLYLTQVQNNNLLFETSFALQPCLR